MQLANQKAKLEDCPYVSEAGKQSLAASSAPPIRLVKVGTGKATLEMGDETELYRHDKKFFHPVRYAMTISDTLTESEAVAKVQRTNAMRFERVGQIMAMDLVCVRNDSKDANKFVATAEKVASSTELPLVLSSEDPVAIRAVLLQDIRQGTAHLCGEQDQPGGDGSTGQGVQVPAGGPRI